MFHCSPLVTSEPSNETAQCHRLLTYNEMVDLLANSPCAPTHYNSRIQRAATGEDGMAPASTNNIYALQSTINDHRTMIDDHRTMIHYLMNNTVNITHLNQYYANQHASTTPIWSSWRDLSLVLMVFISFIVIVGLLFKRLHLLDRLTSFLLRRQENKQQLIQPKSNTKGDNNTTTTAIRPSQLPIQVPIATMPSLPLANIARDYIQNERDSNYSL